MRLKDQQEVIGEWPCVDKELEEGRLLFYYAYS